MTSSSYVFLIAIRPFMLPLDIFCGLIHYRVVSCFHSFALVCMHFYPPSTLLCFAFYILGSMIILVATFALCVLFAIALSCRYNLRSSVLKLPHLFYTLKSFGLSRSL